jgi:hypothetical protein
VSRFAHTPLQLTSSFPHPVAVHAPETHDAVSPHALPQSPQLFLSLVTSVQTPAQSFFGKRHGPSVGASESDEGEVSPPEVPVSRVEESCVLASSPPSGLAAVAHPASEATHTTTTAIEEVSLDCMRTVRESDRPPPLSIARRIVRPRRSRSQL